nr:aspartyl/asparaginyl beta-hydroxylase-like [Zootoca vivipara]
MVIALLGMWTSVTVVWLELVDYEEVLGKLENYDADGDGDFDVEDAKALLGLKEKSVPEQQKTRDAEEVIQPTEEPHGRAKHRSAEGEPEEEDEMDTVLRQVLESEFEKNE